MEQAATGGFGLRVIRASVESQLGGAVAFEWRREGLRCAICIPNQVRPEFTGNSQAASQKPGAQGPVEVGPRKRVLLVEDESLIAMMMEQTLRESDLCLSSTNEKPRRKAGAVNIVGASMLYASSTDDTPYREPVAASVN